MDSFTAVFCQVLPATVLLNVLLFLEIAGVFLDLKEAEDIHTIPVTVETKAGIPYLAFQAGSLQGITRGSEFNLHHWASLSSSAPPFATVKITKVREITSIISPIGVIPAGNM